MTRHSIALLLFSLFAAAIAPAWATDVSLIGTFDTKAAILAVNGGAPKTVRVGQSFGGVTVVSVEKERATVDVDGKRRVLVRGQTYSTSGTGDRQTAVLVAGQNGHYTTQGLINGSQVRFVVDTGASVVALPASDAQRLGLDYRKGQLTTVQTAAGPTPAYTVRFDTVRVGGIELNNVEGMVIESGLPIALLGMSFLNRVEIRNDAGQMTMTKRF
ncbi:MAG TPA: TIGR02281 family clan AA aspartic protease [Burkholderiales bacterium]|jgi:aspartyl protease family protein|nr:TIGR02281 family clan AA aspartic protease [Burkholderiales bacterium]